MRTLVLGVGNIGFAVALDMVRSGYEVGVADRNRERVKAVSKKLGVDGFKVSVEDEGKLSKICSDFDLVCVALPSHVAFNAVRRIVELGKNVVDVSYSPQDPFQLDFKAMDKGVSVVVDAGLAPGISNILCGRIYREMDTVNEAIIYVGGLALNPSATLGLAATWNVEDLIEEYVRPARIVEDGEIREVDPLTFTTTVEVPGHGKFECFATDGLRTMLKTLRVKKLIEYTLRYPGHIKQMRLLKEIGLLSDESMEVDNVRVSPRRFLSSILRKHLSKSLKDKVILYTKFSGYRRGKKSNESYLCIHEYDEKHDLTAMSEVTGFTTSIIAQMVAKRLIDRAGVMPPEHIGFQEKLFNYFMRQLSEREVRIEKL